MRNPVLQLEDVNELWVDFCNRLTQYWYFEQVFLSRYVKRTWWAQLQKKVHTGRYSEGMFTECTLLVDKPISGPYKLVPRW